MTTDSDRIESWSRYWASGAGHSCAGTFGDTYGGAIAEFWMRVFGRLSPGSRVLDIATGNGALPRLLLESNVSAVEIDAIDLARLCPQWVGKLPEGARNRLRFHSGVGAEALPFSDASFDLVISQYGIEYSEISATAAQVRRVLAPGANVALLLHHQDSLPVSLGREELAHLDWLTAVDGVVERGRALLPFMARLGTPEGLASVRLDPDATHCRAEFNAAMRALDARALAHSSGAAAILVETQANLGELLRQSAQLGFPSAVTQFDLLIDALRESRLRQQDLVACALDLAAVQALGNELAAGRSMSVEVGTVEVRSELFGWTLELLPRL